MRLRDDLVLRRVVFTLPRLPTSEGLKNSHYYQNFVIKSRREADLRSQVPPSGLIRDG